MESTEATKSTITEYAGTPQIVHVSDIHGYITEARSALLAVGEHSRFEPLVVEERGELQWATNDYVLVVNGDLIDRGDANEACMDLVSHLQQQAPPGRVRYHIGNHEMGILFPSLYHWPDAYSANLDANSRRAFLNRIRDGEIGAAFEGYQYTYSHAGSNDEFSVPDVNADVRSAATTLLEGTDTEATHQHLVEKYNRVFGLGQNGSRRPGAGICWLDFAHLDESAPPQIVGHSQRRKPVRKGNVVCGNIIRLNRGAPGGEGVLIEDPDSLTAVIRGRNGDIVTKRI